MRPTGLAANLDPILLADFLVNFDRKAPALPSFTPVKSVFANMLNVELLPRLGIAIPRLTNAPELMAGSGWKQASRKANRALSRVPLVRETSTDDRSRVVLVIFNGDARPAPCLPREESPSCSRPAASLRVKFLSTHATV